MPPSLPPRPHPHPLACTALTPIPCPSPSHPLACAACTAAAGRASLMGGAMRNPHYKPHLNPRPSPSHPLACAACAAAAGCASLMGGATRSFSGTLATICSSDTTSSCSHCPYGRAVLYFFFICENSQEIRGKLLVCAGNCSFSSAASPAAPARTAGKGVAAPNNTARTCKTHRLVLDDVVCVKVDEEDVAGHEPPLALHVGRVDVHHPHLGRHHHPPALGHVVPGGVGCGWRGWVGVGVCVWECLVCVWAGVRSRRMRTHLHTHKTTHAAYLPRRRPQQFTHTHGRAGACTPTQSNYPSPPPAGAQAAAVHAHTLPRGRAHSNPK